MMNKYNFLPEWYIIEKKNKKFKKRFLTFIILFFFLISSVVAQELIRKKIDLNKKENTSLINDKIQAFNSTKQTQITNKKFVNNFKNLMLVLMDDKTVEIELLNNKMNLTIENEDYSYCKNILGNINKQFSILNYSIINSENIYKISIEMELK